MTFMPSWQDIAGVLMVGVIAGLFMGLLVFVLAQFGDGN